MSQVHDIPTEDHRVITQCLHCQQEVPGPNEAFCCQGCETVYGLLNRCGLAEYYQIRERLGVLRPAQAVQTSSSVFHYLDDPEQVEVLYDSKGGAYLDFYLEGVHCAACVWLVEKLPEFFPQVLSARLNLANSSARITITPGSKFEPVANQLVKWGYRPHLIQKQQDREQHAKKEQVLMLSRIGVAAFAAGNLMILAVALYAGIQGPLAHYFEWLSLLLALPAVTFSAWPFYRQAWSQLFHQRQISIDVPIALSLVLGTLGGIYELIWGSKQIYFDSLAMLVFLLLFSRYSLLRTQQFVLGQDRLMAFYTPEEIEKRTESGWQKVPMKQLQAGDQVLIHAGQRLPADGILISGADHQDIAYIDQSLLTGEPLAQAVHTGEPVYCGTRLQEGQIEVKITALNTQTRLGQIFQQAQSNLEEKTHLTRLADRLAQRFVSVVLVLLLGLAILFWNQPHEALIRALALAIISCPCALALATPLMIQMSLKRAMARGFFVRKAESLEKLPDLKSIVFDKTGTLTQGRFEVLASQGLEDPQVLQTLISLESHSQHPVARSLVKELLSQKPQALLTVDEFEVLSTGGIAGRIQDHYWRVTPDQAYASTQAQIKLNVFQNNTQVASLIMGDQIRPDASAIMRRLKEMGYTIWLLSGDQDSACQAIAQQAGIDPEKVLSRQSPEDKERFFQTHTDAMMVGDGINDMMALSKARVGISVQGSADENLQSSDIYLAEQGIAQLPGLLKHARITRRFISLTLGFSLTYNILGMGSALLGLVNPLVAAILMPLSAFTVLSLTLIGEKRLCKS